MSRLTDQPEVLLVAAARRGDRESLQELLRRNWGWLRAMLLSRTGRTQELDDILQEVCVKVIRKIGELREPERFRAWLLTMARNAAAEYYRGKKIVLVRLDEAAIIEPVDTAVPTPDAALEGGEERQRLLDTIGNLPEKYRETLLMACQGQMTYNEMAATLDVPVTTFQIRLVRARRMVQQQIAGRENQKIPRS
jgi:RNA polymerase sigma-70 factor (ECF subfamily)